MNWLILKSKGDLLKISKKNCLKSDLQHWKSKSLLVFAGTP